MNKSTKLRKKKTCQSVMIMDDFSSEKNISCIKREIQLIERYQNAIHQSEQDDKLIISVVKIWLKYAAVVWSPHKKDIRKVEKIQAAAPKMIPSLR